MCAALVGAVTVGCSSGGAPSGAGSTPASSSTQTPSDSTSVVTVCSQGCDSEGEIINGQGCGENPHSYMEAQTLTVGGATVAVDMRRTDRSSDCDPNTFWARAMPGEANTTAFALTMRVNGVDGPPQQSAPDTTTEVRTVGVVARKGDKITACLQVGKEEECLPVGDVV